MSETPKKKQLKLMPEVLPAPGPLAPGGPRQRILANMNRLSAVAAAVAVLGGCGEKGGTGGGYGVVDPMPAPAQCKGVAGTIQATAAWKAKEGGGLVVEITLSKPARADASYFKDADAYAWNGKITAAQITADTAVLTFEPDAGVTSASATVGATCTQGKGHVSVSLNLSAPRAAGTAVPVTLDDSY